MIFRSRLLMGVLIFTLLPFSASYGPATPAAEPPLFTVPDNHNDAGESTAMTHLLGGPLHFVVNGGQMDESILYYAKSESCTALCTEKGLVFQYPKGRVSLALAGGRAVRPEARDKLPGKYNYYFGSSPESWQTGLSTFREIIYRGIYPGIDLVYRGDRRRLKYAFYVHPGADPNTIRMVYEGTKGVSVDQETGEIVIQTEWGAIRDAAPKAYQVKDGEREDVAVSFCASGGDGIGFAVGNYDPHLTLVLDPTYSTYLGGDGGDVIRSITVDKWGNTYVTGWTESISGFPIKNAYQATHGADAGEDDVYVTKISSSGTLLFSTFLGGDGDDCAMSIRLDNSGNPYLTGWTDSSSGFPLKDAFQGSLNGYGDAFITKLSYAGELVFSTYLGSDSYDGGSGIAVDGSGNAYVVGTVGSGTGFPLLNAFQSAFGGGSSDGFITKVSGDGDLIFSTLFGGNDWDSLYLVGLDGSNNAYISGKTHSTSGFPIQSAYQSTFGGGFNDTFAAKISSAGALVFSTYLGGNEQEAVRSLAVDSAGTMYVSGQTYSSSGFPIKDAVQSSYGGGRDAFVTAISGSGTLIYSTYLGGASEDNGVGIAVDGSGNAYATGWTASASGFPLKDAFQNTHGGGGTDTFVTRLSSSGSLLYSTYLGGNGRDDSHSIVVNPQGRVCLSGTTTSDSGFPVKNAYQSSYGGVCDIYVASLSAGGALLYSTYIGGSAAEWGMTVNELLPDELVRDGSGNVIVAATTHSLDFPTLNPFQASLGGGDDDVFVTKLSVHKRPDFLGTWDGQGVYFRNSETAQWIKLATPAELIAAGDLDGDKKDDLITVFPSPAGVWTRSSSTGKWTKLSSTSANHISSGDMNGDGRMDLLATFDGTGTYYQNSLTGAWVKMAQPADLLASGDLDGDSTDDLITVFPSPTGVWVKYSKTGKWGKLSSTSARDIASGEMNGDGVVDLLATWDGTGVYYRNSLSGAWVKIGQPADQVTAGDIDEDAKDDLVASYSSPPGVYVKYSKTGTWTKLGNPARDIAAGLMRGGVWGSSQFGSVRLDSPLGGYAESPVFLSGYVDLSEQGPGGWRFAAQEEKNLIPQAAFEIQAAPGDPGFTWAEEENLFPGEAAKSREKSARKRATKIGRAEKIDKL